MSTFKVDSNQVKESVDTLRKILDECKQLYNQSIPESDVDKGKTHNELYNLCQKFKTTCQYFGELVNNSILFLGQSSEMFDTSDRNSAAAISVPHTSTGNFGGGLDRIPLDTSSNNTVSAFQTKLSVLSNKEGFKEGQNGPSGYAWMDWVSSYTTTNGVTVTINGASCFAMAHMMQAEVIGERGNRITTSNTADIKIGDVIHYYGDRADATYGHWVFVTNINDNILTVAEGNGPVGQGKVSYGRNINLNNISLVEIDRVNDFKYQ